MIISVEYENGVLKVTPALDDVMGQKLAEATLQVAKNLEDGRDPFFSEDEEDAEERLEELKNKVRSAISELEDLV